MAASLVQCSTIIQNHLHRDVLFCHCDSLKSEFMCKYVACLLQQIALICIKTLRKILTKKFLNCGPFLKINLCYFAVD